MNIAVAADGKNFNSQVSERFENCEYLLIVNMESLSITAIENLEMPGYSAGASLVKEVLKYDCEAVIVGKIEPEAFDTLVDACVTRYSGFGNTVQKALELMQDRKLELIKNLEGSQSSCSGNHLH